MRLQRGGQPCDLRGTLQSSIREGNIPNPIILATGTPFTPGMPLTSDISVTGSTPHELQFTTVWDEFAGWVIYVNGQLMASFAPGTWDGSFYNLPTGTSPSQTTPGAPLQATKANTFQAREKVTGGTTEAFDLSDNPSVVEMNPAAGSAPSWATRKPLILTATSA